MKIKLYPWTLCVTIHHECLDGFSIHVNLTHLQAYLLSLVIGMVDDFLMSSTGVAILDSICMQFIAIGESLKGLDKVTRGELLTTHPEIDWKNVKGLRDIIAHHYFEVDADQIWWIIENELQPLKKAILEMLESLKRTLDE